MHPPRRAASRKLARCWISISPAWNGSLRLRVADTGRGLAFGRRVEEGVGLSSSRERPRHLCGDAGRLTLSNLAEGGCAAEVEIPLRTEPSPEVESDG